MAPATPMPAVFLGHGNPMNAVADNAFTRAWRELGAALPRPRAVLAVSAHWYVRGTRVTGAELPPTIHDFGGFPPELYRVEYPARGDRRLAEEVQTALAPTPVLVDQEWGLDHGTWSVLRHVFPEADVPVVQLSLDRTQRSARHYDLGRMLQPLRDEGVLVLGSGNVVHNLHAYAWGRHAAEPYPWAVRFEQRVRQLLAEANHDPLIAYSTLGEDAALAVPTPDHYLPLLYVAALARPGEPVRFPIEGVDGGSVSMLAVRVG